MKKIYSIFTLGLFVFGFMFMADKVMAIEEVTSVLPISPANIVINSPTYDTTVTEGNVILKFTATNSDTCWYDLGGLKVTDGVIATDEVTKKVIVGDPNDSEYKYSINCQGDVTIDLPVRDGGRDGYVLNLWGKNGDTPNGTEALDSTFFKVQGVESQVEMVITSPEDDSIVTTNNSHQVQLKYTTTNNPTSCWYDLGGLEVDGDGIIKTDPITHNVIIHDDYRYPLNNCNGTANFKLQERDEGRDGYVLNLWGTNDTITDPSHYGLASIMFKVKNKTENNNGGSSGGSVPQQIAVVTPTITPETGRVLGAEKFNFTLDLRKGDKGNEVTELHKKLIADQYLKIVAPTGYFGPLTFRAVQAFQLANSLKGDGIVGPLTRAALNK